VPANGIIGLKVSYKEKYMKKIALLSLFAVSMFAESWTGTITDAACGAKHADASEASQKCAERCFAKSGAAVLVVGDKVVKIDKASNDKIKAHVGHKVKVTGKLADDAITVDSVEMAH
jgi:hypothetical protein